MADFCSSETAGEGEGMNFVVPVSWRVLPRNVGVKVMRKVIGNGKNHIVSFSGTLLSIV